MLIFIGSPGYARLIGETYRDAFYYSHEFGYKNHTGENYHTLTNSLSHKAGELTKHLIHPIPIGQKVTPPFDFGLIDLTIGQLATSHFRTGIDVCESPYLRLALVMHYEHIQLTVKPRAKIVVPFSDEGLRDLISIIP